MRVVIDSRVAPEARIEFTEAELLKNETRKARRGEIILPQQVTEKLGLVYTPEQLQVPLPSVETLSWCQGHNFAVIAKPPMSMTLIEIIVLFFKNSPPPTPEFLAGVQELPSEDVLQPGWLMLGKTPLENSKKKTWAEQQAILPDNLHVPSAVEVIYGSLTYGLVYGDQLFVADKVRTRTLMFGKRVRVGWFDSLGFTAYHDKDDERSWESELAVALKD